MCFVVLLPVEIILNRKTSVSKNQFSRCAKIEIKKHCLPATKKKRFLSIGCLIYLSCALPEASTKASGS